MHLDGQLALQQSAVEVLPYFNVCQFPRHLVELLKYLEKHEENGCKLSKQVPPIISYLVCFSYQSCCLAVV